MNSIGLFSGNHDVYYRKSTRFVKNFLRCDLTEGRGKWLAGSAQRLVVSEKEERKELTERADGSGVQWVEGSDPVTGKIALRAAR